MPDPDASADVAPLTLDDRYLQGAGVVQGGVVAGVLGDAVDRCVRRVVDIGATIELETIDVLFERPALPGAFTTRASTTRRGRSLVACEACLLDATGRIVASARSTHRVATP